MKEFRAAAINIGLTERFERDELHALAEIIIVVSEPSFTVDAAGDLIRQRGVEQFRFGASTDAIRKLIKIFEAYLSEMEKAEKRYTRVPDPEEPEDQE
jgi:hypothetical protein